MLAFGMLIFAIATFIISFLIVRSDDLDKGKIATCITLTAWGSLMFGVVIGRIIL